MDQKAIETLPFGQARFKPDTAAGCREKATANLAQAVSLHTGHERTLLERSAAAWSMRAEQLQRQESKLAPGHAGPESDRWENEGGGIRPAPPPVILEELQQELGRYGIASVELTVYEWGGYRYSTARDAIAAAKRSAKP